MELPPLEIPELSWFNATQNRPGRQFSVQREPARFSQH
jgi:hypothetical protein